MLLNLIKYRISLAVTISAAFGFLFFRQEVTYSFYYCLAGVFLLASAASVFNQVQEVRYDKIMKRTSGRPIPSGRISTNNALIIAIFLLLTGSAFLLYGCGWMSFLIGAITVVWYNLVYTYLKRITVYAAVPGALTGALPPLIGWFAAGAETLSFEIIYLGILFFIWQIPHFWLLLFKFGEEYKEAGFKSITSKFSYDQLLVITSAWIVATGACSMLFPILGVTSSVYTFVFIMLLNLWLLAFTIVLLFKRNKSYRPLFMQLNLFFLLSILAILSDKFLL